MANILVKDGESVEPTIFQCRESRRIITPETDKSMKMSLHKIIRYERGVSYLVRYPENDEILFVIEGEGYIIEGDEKYPIRPGSAVFIPTNTGYKVYNSTDLTMLAILSPPRYRDDWKGREDLVMLECSE